MERRARSSFAATALGTIAFATLSTATHADCGAARIIEGQPTLGPLAFVRFCMSNQRECQTSGGAGRVALTPALAGQLAEVNASVNADIAIDREHVGRISWSVTGRSGDCNTFALHKRHRLLEKGLPAGALSLAVVRLRSGAMHLVLVVRTDRGDLVLDNLARGIMNWTSTPYVWVAVQSMKNPERWVEVSAQAAELSAPAGRSAEFHLSSDD